MMSDLKITAYQCKQCGRIHYPLHERCIDCLATEFEEVHPEGDAKLLAFTEIYNLPWGFDVRTLKIGVVEFANKVRAMGQIHVDDFSKLKTGMKLKAYWEPVRNTDEGEVFGLVLKE